MNFTVAERFTAPKSNTVPNEDGIVTTKDFAAVIDGSTSKTNFRLLKGERNGHLCMRLIKEYIHTLAPTATLQDFCNGVTLYIASCYTPELRKRLFAHPEDRLTASCVVYSHHRGEIWMVGDCQCQVDGQLYDNPKPYEATLSAKRARICNSLLSEGKMTTDQLRINDKGRQAIMQDLISCMQGQNKEYAVIDGFPIPLNLVRVVTIPQYAHTLILASDGYPLLRPTLEESEQALALQRHNDPLNIKTFRATKAFMAGNNSFDDRSYLRLCIGRTWLTR